MKFKPVLTVFFAITAALALGWVYLTWTADPQPIPIKYQTPPKRPPNPHVAPKMVAPKFGESGAEVINAEFVCNVGRIVDDPALMSESYPGAHGRGDGYLLITGLDQPRIGVDSNGNCYLSDDVRLLKFSPDGALVDSFTPPQPGEFHSPRELYERYAKMMVKYEKARKTIRQYVSLGFAPENAEIEDGEQHWQIIDRLWMFEGRPVLALNEDLHYYSPLRIQFFDYSLDPTRAIMPEFPDDFHFREFVCDEDNERIMALGWPVRNGRPYSADSLICEVPPSGNVTSVEHPVTRSRVKHFLPNGQMLFKPTSRELSAGGSVDLKTQWRVTHPVRVIQDLPYSEPLEGNKLRFADATDRELHFIRTIWGNDTSEYAEVVITDYELNLTAEVRYTDELNKYRVEDLRVAGDYMLLLVQYATWHGKRNNRKHKMHWEAKLYRLNRS